MKTLASAFLATTVLAFSACSIYESSSLGPELARAKAAGAPILIYAIGVPGEIPVGEQRTAVPVYIQFLVTSEQPIKRIRFFFAAYSRRGHPVLNHQGQHLQMILIGPGQFAPGGNYEVNSFHSNPAGFPGGSVACVELRSMVLTYNDGQRQDFDRSSLVTTLVPPLRRDCRDKGPSVEALMSSSSS